MNPAILFFILALIAGRASEAESAPYINLGKTVIKSSLSTGEISYRYKEKWAVGWTAISDGYTTAGYQEQVSIVSFSRIIRPGWHIWKAEYFMRIGVGRVTETPLVGHGNYRIGGGFDFGIWEIECTHYSSADINRNNQGIDMIGVRIEL